MRLDVYFLIVYSYTIIAAAFSYGFYRGQWSIGEMSGPALYRCVEILGGTYGHKKTP